MVTKEKKPRINEPLLNKKVRFGVTALELCRFMDIALTEDSQKAQLKNLKNRF